MTPCIADIPGCAECEAQARRRDPGHECAAMCEITQGMKTRSSKGHQLMHSPFRHQCGHILDDRKGTRSHGPRTICRFGNCVQFFCPGCRRYDMGWGPIMCPCETGRHGHGTRDEYRRPSVRHLIKRPH